MVVTLLRSVCIYKLHHVIDNIDCNGINWFDSRIYFADALTELNTSISRTNSRDWVGPISRFSRSMGDQLTE